MVKIGRNQASSLFLYLSMTIKEIIDRPNGSQYTVEEMCYIIEQYVLIKKGYNVTINPYKGCILGRNLNPLLFKIELKKLIKAFNYAISFINH